MVAVYNEDTDTWSTPHTDDNSGKPKRHRRTKEEMEAARAAGDVGDRAPSSRKSGLRAVIKDLVETVNAAVYTLPWTHEDALNADEAELLINGIDKAAQVSPTLKRWLQAGSALTGWGALIYATTIIALPRMARHGLIPVPALKQEPEAVQYDNVSSGNGYQPDFSPSVATG